MSSILQDFRYSLRLLRRTPGFTAVAVIVLALGIGANTAVFSLVNAVLLKPMPGRVGEAVGVFGKNRAKPDSYFAFSYPAYTDLRDGNDVFDGLLAHGLSLVGIREGDVTRRTFAEVVSSNYFTTLGVPLAAGRAFSADEERPGSAAPVAVASDDLWRRYGREPGFLGRTVVVNARPFTIIGIAPRGFTGTMALASPDLWFPLGAYDQIVSELFRSPGTGIADRASEGLVLVGHLKPGVSIALAQTRLDQIARRLEQQYPADNKDRAFTVTPLPRLGTSTSPRSSDPAAGVSALLLTMSGLVLVVACLNLTNLMLARGSARRKEIAVRLALGGGRARIVRQLLIEGLTLSLLGAAVGVLIAWWTTGLLVRSMAIVAPVSVVIDAVPDVRVLAAACAFAVLSTLCFALGPAWSSSNAALVPDLKGEARGGTSSRLGLRRLTSGPALVICQLAVSLALVAAGGLFVRGALNISLIDPGFSLDRQLLVNVDAGLAGYDEARGRATYRTVLDRLRALQGVEQASMASTVPFGDITEEHKLQAGDKTADAIFLIVGADYFRTLGLSMLRGREFTRAEEEKSERASTIAVVNLPLARTLFGDADPIGRQIQLGEAGRGVVRTLEIVGVAPGLRHSMFDPAPVPQIYVALGGPYRGNMNIHLRVAAGPQAATLDAVRHELRQADDRLPIVSMNTMLAHRDTSLPSWAIGMAARLFTVFGGLALLLATIGVYGLKAYDVARRTREIGIRMALGASGGDVQRLVLGEGLRTTAVGLAAGLILAVAVGKMLSGLLFRASPFDPVVMATASAMLAAAAMLAAYMPARRATRVVPIEALRAE